MIAPLQLAVPARGSARAERDRAVFGLIVYLISKAMFFVALVGAYIVLSHTQRWPPPGTPSMSYTRALPATVLLVVSGITAGIAPAAIRRGRPRAACLGLAVTIALGAVFVMVQLAEWVTLYREGLQGTSYSQFFYVLTAFHLFYIATGLVLLSLALVRARAGRYTRERRTGIDLSAMWWHFCGGVWLVLFFAIYLAPEVPR